MRASASSFCCGETCEVALLDGGHGERLVLDLDRDRVLQVALGDAPDLARQGGREEGRLPPLGRLREDPLDVLDEAHAEHLVRLVEHHHADGVEAERAPPQVVHDPPRRADDHVDAAVEPLELELDRLAAVDRQHAHAAEVLGIGVDRLRHLDRQLAGGREHQRLHLGRGEIELLQDREGERRRLARAGLRLADQVAPGEHRRDRLLLDRRRRLVADLGERLQDGRRKPQALERRRVILSSSSRLP